MAEKTGHEKCNCGSGSPVTVQGPPAVDPAATLVKANVPQGYEAKFNIRIVPGRSIKDAIDLRPDCKPRGHRQGWTAGTLGLTPEVVAVLARSDKAMTAWLAKDAANAQRYLANPVAAMREAGVDLSRAEEKTLSRLNAEVNDARKIPSAGNVASIAATMYPNGRVGGIGTTKPDRKPDDFGCNPKRKG
jgi:hypothetical protein